MAQCEDSKPPFDTLVNAVANRLKVALGDQQAVHRAVAKVLREDLSSQCDLSHFAVNFLRVDPSTVDDLMSAADGNREAQIDSLLSKWVELWEERATLEAVLKAIYDADETLAIQKIVEALESGVCPPLRSLADTDKSSPLTHEGHFVKNESQSQDVGRFSMYNTTKDVAVPTDPQTSGPQSEPETPPEHAVTPIDQEGASPSLAQQETTLADLQEQGTPSPAQQVVTLVDHQEPATPSHVDHQGQTTPPPEQQVALVQEQPTSSPVQQAATSVDHQGQATPSPLEVAVPTNDTQELVTLSTGQQAGASIDPHSEQVTSVIPQRVITSQINVLAEIEALKRHQEKMEDNIQQLQDEQKRANMHHSQVGRDLEARVAQLETENCVLTESVASLRSELFEANLKLQKALEEVAQLKADKEQLNREIKRVRDENKELKEEKEALEIRVANAEKNCSESQDELQENKERLLYTKDNYERMLREKQAMLEKVQEELKSLKDSQAANAMHPQSSSWWEELQECPRIGKGAYGEVFLVKYEGVECAVKNITVSASDTTTDQAELMRSFATEFEALSTCDHPRVVKYLRHHFETDDSNTLLHMYILMEYVPQGSLWDLLQKGKLEEKRVARYTTQLLEAIEHVHDCNIFHRDIKCRNILLDNDDNIKLSDFGLAECIDGDYYPYVGTVHWMSPEAAERKPHDLATKASSDVWSVGVTVMEMLLGKNPFKDRKNSLQTGDNIAKFINKLDISEAAKDFLNLCLKWDPQQRAKVDVLLKSQFCCL